MLQKLPQRQQRNDRKFIYSSFYTFKQEGVQLQKPLLKIQKADREKNIPCFSCHIECNCSIFNIVRFKTKQYDGLTSLVLMIVDIYSFFGRWSQQNDDCVESVKGRLKPRFQKLSLCEQPMGNLRQNHHRKRKSCGIFKLHLDFFFNIIFSMWYCYLLSNQKTSNFGQQEAFAQYSFALNHESICKYIQNDSENFKTNFHAPVVLIEKNQPIERNFKNQTAPKHCEILNPTLSPKFRDNFQKNISTTSNAKTKKSPKNVEQELRKGKNPGRNSTSNIFRVFLKLCSKPKLESIVSNKFTQIISSHSLSISYQYFKLRLKELSPSTSNYVNIKEFKKIWQGESQFSKAFRCLFHWFVNNFAINHSLTLKGKHMMMRESIMHFLNNLHQIEAQLWDIEREEGPQDFIKSEDDSKSNHTQ